MDTFILRFRDISKGVNTIQEHQKIIIKNGSVWWGWWKKHDEESNEEYLKSISVDLKKEKILSIGLFNRSTDEYFEANLCNMEFDFSEQIYTPSQELTPEYYNSQSLFCWFKLSHIKIIQLEEFERKFIKVPSSLEKSFFLSSKSNTIVQQRIKVESNYILHISDIHFGTDYGFPAIKAPDQKPLIDHLDEYINYEKDISIGLILISGDLTSRGDVNQFFQQVINFLNLLCEKFSLTKEKIVIVPGNHDIPLTNADKTNYSHEETYKAFLNQFYGEKKEISGINTFLLPDNIKVDILRINSIRLREEHESNFGYVGWDDYPRIIQESGISKNKSVKIALLHHHLLPVPNEEALDSLGEFGSVSVTVDSGKVIEGLQNYGFQIVLHGHQHVPGLNKVGRGRREEYNLVLDKELYLLGAGSLGAKVDRLSGHMRDNSFSILKIQESNIEIEAMQFNMSKKPELYFKTQIKLKY